MSGSQNNIINSPGNEVPDNTIAVVSLNEEASKVAMSLLGSLKGDLKRDWFTSHFYYCLPLTIGNQHGYALYAESDFSVIWDGGNELDNLKINREDWPENSVQHYSSHFGSGIITIQNNWTFRTPPGINLMTINPPNIIKDGITHMVGVVETDNLRRDFTFNLKVTRPNTEISFKRGEIIGAFIPLPRYFVESFDIKLAEDLFSDEQIQMERDTMLRFGELREKDDADKPHGAGRLYFKGLDAWGNKFDDHQKSMI